MRDIRNLILFLCLSFYGCKDSFTPDLPQSNLNILVVEGFIDAGGNPTYIKLNRTTMINETRSLKPELGAVVTVEGGNKVFMLTHSEDGIYSVSALTLEANEKYRVRIKTADRKEYLSEFVDVKLSPNIEKLAWKNSANGAEIYVNTKDINNSTRYYRWEFEQTWVIYSKYSSRFIWDIDRIRMRTDAENINKCWLSERSSSIVLGSSIQLTDDVINEKTILNIPFNSEKFVEKYSILVKQYALGKEEYEFWEELRKNTESLGSIFDPQPSQIVGNLKCITDPNTLVIGYIGAGSVNEKRLFITADEVPFEKSVDPFECPEVDTVVFSRVSVFNNPNFYPTDLLFSENSPNAIGYGGAPRQCVDCTLRGVNIKPNFWQ